MAERRRAAQSDQPADGEFRGSGRMGTAVISGATFRNRSVVYHDVDGLAIFEGDIVLGTTEAVQAATDAARDAVAREPEVAFGVGITGSQYRWPNCRIPYEIDTALPNQQRVTDAIAHWEANTAFRFPLRTLANASQYPNYVRFTDAGGCWSLVGMQTGMQQISLGTGCSSGNAIHEIGHAVGLWHEQSREDRDLFVTIHWENILAGYASQFNQHITDGDDLGVYDYGSIMHYPRTAFSSNGQDTITPTDPNAQIGQRVGLSPGDIAAVQSMYPGCFIKRPFLEPGGAAFKKIVDEPGTVKLKFRDDGQFKKIRDDDIVLKTVRDPKLPRDPGPIKVAMDPQPGPETIITQPGVLQPFTLAIGHRAPLGPGVVAREFDPASATYLASLQRQLLELQAGISRARATAAEAEAEAARLQEASDAVSAAYDQALRDAASG